VHEDEVRHRAHEWDELHEDPDDLVLISFAPDGVAMVCGIKHAPRHDRKDGPRAEQQQEHRGIEAKSGRENGREEEHPEDPQADPNLASHATIVHLAVQNRILTGSPRSTRACSEKPRHSFRSRCSASDYEYMQPLPPPPKPAPLEKEDPSWVLWVLVIMALGVFSIAVQEFRQDNPGEGVTWALLGLVAGRRGVLALWRRRRAQRPAEKP